MLSGLARLIAAAIALVYAPYVLLFVLAVSPRKNWRSFLGVGRDAPEPARHQLSAGRDGAGRGWRRSDWS